MPGTADLAEARAGTVAREPLPIVMECRQAGIALSAMDVVLDGVRVKQRLRCGEPAFSVLARATSSGRSLS
ncbi:hypothetical protein [Streptomyces violaceusniger]|uniref:hypothetical protein n=1 Tax=Streptomyces violaceusniger TaxID=68280 RepID=UPI0036884107